MAMRRSMLLASVDFSPTEVDREKLLLGFKRAMIYRWIQRGELNAIKDAYGHYRITAEELDRFRKILEERIANSVGDPELDAKIRSHQNRASALHRVATTSPGEMIAPMLAARRRNLEQTVDPEGKCSPQELEWRVEREQAARMERLTAKSLQAVKWKREYIAAHNPP